MVKPMETKHLKVCSLEYIFIDFSVLILYAFKPWNLLCQLKIENLDENISNIDVRNLTWKKIHFQLIDNN
jgi:hypothetical protein